MRINDLKAGDILSCEGNGLISKGIRLVTKSPITHTARVINHLGELYVIGSQLRGTNPIRLDNWLKKYEYSFHVHRDNYCDIDEVSKKLMSKCGVTYYDFISLIIWQPLYIITGFWKGKSKGKAEKRMYCSELQAWVMKIKKWWTYSPVALFNYMNKHVGRFDYIGYFKYKK